MNVATRLTGVVVAVAVVTACANGIRPERGSQKRESLGPSARAPSTDKRPLAAGIYRIAYSTAPGGSPGTESGPSPSVVVTVPSGWIASTSWAIEKDYGSTDVDAGPSFVVWTITNTYVNPCTKHELVSPRPGPGVNALVSALSALQDVAADSRPVAVDGYRGTSVQLTITTNIGRCPDGFWTWGDPDGHRYAKVGGETDRVYILDVDGQRRTFFASIPPRTPSSDRTALEGIIASIDIVV